MEKNLFTDLRPAVAEMIAVFALVFIGGGAVIINSLNDSIGLLGIAFAHGIVLMCMVYATAHISGGHVNPAVTISMWANKLISTKKATLYIIGQLIGAIIASIFLFYIFTTTSFDFGASVPALGIEIDFFKGIFIEAILTFFLVFVIFAVAVDKRVPAGVYGLAIGMVLVFDILMGGALTGAAMNPARAFGPAIIAGNWANQLVYWVGPIIGGIVAGLTYKYLFLKNGKDNL